MCIRNKNLAPGRHYGVSKRHSTSKMSFLAPMPLSAITSSLLPLGDTPHLMCLPETPIINSASQRHSSAQCHPETLSHSMAPTDSMVAHRDTLGYQDTQSPDAVEAPEAPETAISIGDTGLTMYSTGQLSWQHLLKPLITDHSIMTLIH